jgi:hypothetical protein
VILSFSDMRNPITPIIVAATVATGTAISPSQAKAAPGPVEFTFSGPVIYADQQSPAGIINGNFSFDEGSTYATNAYAYPLYGGAGNGYYGSIFATGTTSVTGTVTLAVGDYVNPYYNGNTNSGENGTSSKGFGGYRVS